MNCNMAEGRQRHRMIILMYWLVASVLTYIGCGQACSNVSNLFPNMYWEFKAIFI